MNRSHFMQFGAEVLPGGGVRFRLWAPTAKTVELVLPADEALPIAHSMRQYDRGWYEHLEPRAGVGTRYAYRIDGEIDVPDPASRSNPGGVHSASEVVDPASFVWSDAHWKGRPWEEAVIYELHVGSFTPDGTFAGVAARLDDLAAAGITAIELMPVGAFPGQRGWGYDGVLPFAPHAAYGTADDLKRLVQEAHARDLMVILDVVYNHFGPDGNYLPRYAAPFFTDRYRTPWGAAINFDGENARPVREFFIHNALYWLEEFHFDGLRLDAVHEIHDAGSRHFVAELFDVVQTRLGPGRQIHLVLENHDNAAQLLERPHPQFDKLGGAGSLSQWNDDFHHAAHVSLTGEHSGYYQDFALAPVAHLGRALTEGFAYQGEPSVFVGGRTRGAPSRQLPLRSFVNFLQNHDQIGNRACGERLGALVEPEPLRAALAILLLAPSPPLLFMGEEYLAPQPFQFFCDYKGELARAITTGRRKEFATFPAFADEESRERIPDPCDPSTFARSVLQWSDRGNAPHDEWLAYVTGLLWQRQYLILPLLPSLVTGAATFEVHGANGLLALWPLSSGAVLRLTANLRGSAVLECPANFGNLVFSTHASADGALEALQPWEVRWHLQGCRG